MTDFNHRYFYFSMNYGYKSFDDSYCCNTKSENRFIDDIFLFQEILLLYCYCHSVYAYTTLNRLTNEEKLQVLVKFQFKYVNIREYYKQRTFKKQFYNKRF